MQVGNVTIPQSMLLRYSICLVI